PHIGWRRHGRVSSRRSLSFVYRRDTELRTDAASFRRNEGILHMRTRITFSLFVWSIITLTASFAFADGAKCAALTGKSCGAGVKIDSATWVAGTPNAPEHCDVRGVIAPEAKFAIKLPSDWNNRFYMVGGGGFAGQLSLGPMNAGLQKGYATATTDTGHDATREPLGAFSIPTRCRWRRSLK